MTAIAGIVFQKLRGRGATPRAWVCLGDIGTSPLYALKEAQRPRARAGCLAGCGAGHRVIDLLIDCRYFRLIRDPNHEADNHGEGGILFALISPRRARRAGDAQSWSDLDWLGPLLYGDGAITPAISVLSAIEGIKVDARSYESVVHGGGDPRLVVHHSAYGYP
jgi:KUP system potassium uptake protein